MKELFYGIAFCLLFPYLQQLLDLGMNHLVNIQTLSTAKFQYKIDQIKQKQEINEPCIGFQYQKDEENQEEFEEE